MKNVTIVMTLQLVLFWGGLSGLMGQADVITRTPEEAGEGGYWISNNAGHPNSSANLSSPENAVNQLAPDWTYHTNASMLASITLADLSGDSIDEIIFTTFGEDPNPYSGGSVYAVDINGNNLPGWPKQVNAPIPGTAVVGNINNDSIPDLIVGSWTTLYAWDATGTALPNFPKFIGANVSPAIFDIDRDGELEIIYPTDGTQMFVYNADGTALPGWPVFAPESIGSPAIADIDQDNEYEIVAGTYQGPVGPDPFEIYAWNLDGSVVSGFPVPTSGVVKAAPAVGDLDNDGGVEIIAISYHTSNQDSLYVWDGQGNLKPGWPQPVAYGRLSSPSLGDLDLDGDLEIVIGGWAAPPTSMEQLFAFHHDGSPVANWPVMLNHPGNSGNINNSPVIADIDGDTTTMEVLVKAVDHVFALHGDGTVVTGYPQFIDDQGHSGTFSPSPAVGDMDNDGDVELIFASTFDQIAFFDAPEKFNSNYVEWPMFKHDRYNTASYEHVDSMITSIPQKTTNLPSSFALEQNYPNPFNPRTVVSYQLSVVSRVDLSIYNLLGQKIKTVVNQRQAAGKYTVQWDGRNDAGQSVGSGLYIYRIRAESPKETFMKAKKMILLK